MAIPVYWINLAARTDRRAFMERQFARLGMDATRIEAVTPGEISAEDLDRYCHPRHLRWMKPTEVACTLSHLKALRQFLETSSPFALILEDDIALSTRLPAFLAAPELANLDFDLLHVETGEQRVRVLTETRIGDVEIVRYLGYDPGAAGYVVSRRGAQRVIADRRTRRLPFDQALFDTFGPMGRRLVLRATVPGLCAQSNLESTGISTLWSNLVADKLADDRPAYALRHRLYWRWFAIRRDTIVGIRKLWFERVHGARLMRIPFAPDEHTPAPIHLMPHLQPASSPATSMPGES